MLPLNSRFSSSASNSSSVRFFWIKIKSSVVLVFSKTVTPYQWLISSIVRCTTCLDFSQLLGVIEKRVVDKSSTTRTNKGTILFFSVMCINSETWSLRLVFGNAIYRRTFVGWMINVWNGLSFREHELLSPGSLIRISHYSQLPAHTYPRPKYFNQERPEIG